MRRVVFLALVTVSACASPVTGASYDLGPGVATYDALSAATVKCHADGGEVTLKGGYDKRDLSSYVCKTGGAK